jgi:hypothetical protein
VPVNSQVNSSQTQVSYSGDIQLKNGDSWTVYGAITIGLILICVVVYCVNLIYRHKVVLEEKATAKVQM